MPRPRKTEREVSEVRARAAHLRWARMDADARRKATEPGRQALRSEPRPKPPAQPEVTVRPGKWYSRAAEQHRAADKARGRQWVCACAACGVARREAV